MIAICNIPPFETNAPPLGLAVLSGFLQTKDVDHIMMDVNIDIYSLLSESDKEYWNLDNFSYWNERSKYFSIIHPKIARYLKMNALKVVQKKITTIGLFIHSANFYPTLFFIKILKKINPEIKVFVGGPSASLDLLSVEKQEIDSVITGEGELGTYNFLTRNEKNSSKHYSDSGFSYIEDGNIWISKNKKNIAMDEIGIPAWNKFNLEKYNLGFLPMELSRGCVGRCTFCSEKVTALTYRKKSMINIREELNLISNIKHVEHIIFQDLLLNADHKYLTDICTMMIDNNVKLTWECMCRIDHRLSNELLSTMRSAGCVQITFGVESGSQKILDLMQKNIKVKEICSCVKRCSLAGIKTNIEVLIGHPRESWFDFLHTIHLVYVLRHYLSVIEVGSPMIIEKNSQMFLDRKLYKITQYDEVKWRTQYFTSTYRLRVLRIRLIKIVSKYFGLEAK